MHEVEERLVLDAFRERVGLAPDDLIPTDLRHAQALWKASHAAAQEPEPARLAELFGLIEEHLHADAYAEQGRPFRDTLANEFFKAALAESFHARTERADAGQHKFRRFAQNALVRTNNRIDSAR